jgi:hypothetical protein
MNRMSLVIIMAVAIGFLVAGCGEKPAPPSLPSAAHAATADTRVKCSLCGIEFRLGDAQRPNPNAPQVVCPSCGKTVIPAKAGK